MVLIAALSAGALVLGYLWGRAARPAPVVPRPQTAPPPGVGPAQLNFLLGGHVDGRTVAATLVGMAVSGQVWISWLQPRYWWVGGTGHHAGADPVARAVAPELGVATPGGGCRVSPFLGSGSPLGRSRKLIAAQVKGWAAREGLVRRSAVGTAGWVAVWGSFVVAFLVYSSPVPDLLALPCLAFPVGGAALFTRRRRFARTAAGDGFAADAEGFRQFLAGRVAPRARVGGGQYLAGLPFAVQCGVVREWEGRYRSGSGAWAPVVPWFNVGGGPVDAVALGDFQKAVVGALRTRSGGDGGEGSGGDGGGDSGGGDGGGGGD